MSGLAGAEKLLNLREGHHTLGQEGMGESPEGNNANTTLAPIYTGILANTHTHTQMSRGLVGVIPESVRASFNT